MTEDQQHRLMPLYTPTFECRAPNRASLREHDGKPPEPVCDARCRLYTSLLPAYAVAWCLPRSQIPPSILTLDGRGEWAEKKGERNPDGIYLTYSSLARFSHASSTLPLSGTFVSVLTVPSWKVVLIVKGPAPKPAVRDESGRGQRDVGGTR